MKETLIIITALCIAIACTKPPSGRLAPIGFSGTIISFVPGVKQLIQSSYADNPGYHGRGSNKETECAYIFKDPPVTRNAFISGQIPKTRSLTTAQKSSVIFWIDNGATNN